MTARSAAAPAVTPDDLSVVAGARIFFGHQSVGQNVLDGVRDVYAAGGRPPPAIQDARIGTNEQPLLKIEDFADTMRSDVGRDVDVAMMKLCYVDVTTRTDVRALFETYRTTMAALERDLPHVRFVHVTVPVMTEPTMLSSVRTRLTGQGARGPRENLQRERLNTLLRREYADGHLFDLAAVESTTPAGARVGGRHRGSEYFALYDGYASDSGHLNARGARVAAIAWQATVAGAVRRARG